MKLEFDCLCWDGDKSQPADLKLNMVLAMIKDDYWAWEPAIIILTKTFHRTAQESVLAVAKDPKSRFNLESALG